MRGLHGLYLARAIGLNRSEVNGDHLNSAKVFTTVKFGFVFSFIKS